MPEVVGPGLKPSGARPPAVTVAVPVYNDVRFIGRVLQGLADQTYSDFELIVSDNASTDGTSEICRAFASKHPFVQYVRHEENLGANANFKYGLERARGRYFAWAASDDFWRPDFLKDLVGELDSHPDAATAFCKFVNIDNDNRVLREFDFDFSGSTAFVRLAKFLLSRSRRKDVPIYGLHRTERIRDAKFYSWWGINADRQLRGAYPIVAHLLTYGYRHVDKVLFEGRSDPTQLRSHYLKADSLKERLALNLLEINVHVAMLDAASRALRSFSIIFLLAPVSVISFLITTGWEDVLRVKSFLAKPFRKFRRDNLRGNVG